MGWLADALAPSHQKPIFLREKKKTKDSEVLLAWAGWLTPWLPAPRKPIFLKEIVSFSMPRLQKTNFCLGNLWFF